jgi:5-methylcytosine-specific restriction endonuclease McrA
VAFRDPEAQRAYQAAYRQAHKEKLTAYRAAYGLKHAQRLQDYRAQYYQENKERIKDNSTAWREAHPDKRAASHRKRRAAKYGATNNALTAAQWQEIQAAYQYRCVYCGKKPKRLTMDHLTPLAHGGQHTASNVVPACLSCNCRKQARPPRVPVQPILLTMAPARTKRRTR